MTSLHPRDDETLPVAVVGCDFRTASSRWRSRLVMSGEERARLFADLRAGGAVDGFFALETCLRVEWVVSGPSPAWAAELLRAEMLRRLGVERDAHIEPYVHVGEACADHVLGVVLGRESLVQGERQVARQLFLALERARREQTSSRIINGLGTIAGRIAARAGHAGCLADASFGVHSLALCELGRHLPRGGEVVLVGLGAIGRKVQAALSLERRFRVTLCNRTVAPNEQGVVQPLSALPALLAKADAAVVCTGAAMPTLDRAALCARASDRPIVLFDLGIPEQVSRDLPDCAIRLGLDDLTAQARAMLKPEQLRALERHNRLGVNRFKRLCAEPEIAPVLDALRRLNQRLVYEELPAAIDAELGHLDGHDRDKVTRTVRRMLLAYSHDVFAAFRDGTTAPATSDERAFAPCRCAAADADDDQADVTSEAALRGEILV
jgi:glutamyl-tRNA reductase